MREDRLQELLRDQRAPDEQGAEDRGWQVVRAAFAQHEAVPHHRGLRRLGVAIVAALALLAAAFTPPGQAVTQWVGDAVKPGRKDASKALVSLPAKGRVLVVSRAGPWIIDADGSRRRLGNYDDASWSPHGLFVIATRGSEMVAMDPKGDVRWSLARSSGVSNPRWSPDGFRISYLSGSSLRLVAGDGSDDALLARNVAAVAPEWRPGSRHELAYANPDGSIRLVATDEPRNLWRSGPGDLPTKLAWSADGRRLLALAPGQLRLLDSRGRLLSAVQMPSSARAETAAFGPSGHGFALVSQAVAARRSRVTLMLLEPKARSQRRLLAGAGQFGEVNWSPDGRWLLLSWPDADQWVFIRTAAARGQIQSLRAVSNISSQFDPGSGPGAAFPKLRGWCCPR